MRSKESKISRGWRLTAASWGLMRRDRTMVVLALAGTLLGLAGTALMLDVSGVFSGNYSRGHIAGIGLLFLYPLTFVSVFFNVALTAAASADLEGRRLGVAAALGEAGKRLGRIAGWALIATLVGILIEQIVSRIPGAGRLAGYFFGAAWSLCTIFAIPLLVVEETGPVDAARGSVKLVRSKWGEGLTGIVSISAWTVVAMIPAVILFMVGLSMTAQETVTQESGAGIVLIVCSVVAFFAIGAFANATRQVFNLALYRYAGDLPTPGFAATDLEQPFKRKRSKR
ncbi:MAG: DUF6159 family protein [Solirubrobacterales bacterium]